ncbi:APC family permease [Leucobacter luti]|uniref:APC family permease n=1 Tax=Leucobacter luti TaxID=340320 RepID=UPI0013001E2A|nr:APC family permease [Leucobacter luti]
MSGGSSRGPAARSAGSASAGGGSDSDATADSPAAGLQRGSLGTLDIVFFVVAAAAPLAVVAGAAPLAFRLGGVGAPGAYLFSGLVYILCAAGLTAFASHVRNAGAFYAFVGHGLGRPAAAGTAVVALLSYALICFGFYGFFGFYAASSMRDLFGIELHWSIYAALALAVIAVLGYRQITVGARILGVLMAAEVAILVVIAVAVLATEGTSNFTLEPFAPSRVFDAGSGSMFVLALGAFLGFESTAIYSEEAKNPKRTIPRATYLAVGFLAVFYGFITWIAVAALGLDGLVETSLSDTFQGMYFMLADSYLGPWAKIAMDVLMVTSLFAATLAFHNATSRYLFALGRDGIVSRRFGATHPRFASPFRASIAVSLAAIVPILVTVTLSGDPYLHLLLWTNGVGIVGIVFLQLLCMIAVLRYFWRDRRGHGAFRVVIAPGLGAIGLTLGLWLMLSNFDLLTDLQGWANAALVAPVLLLGIAGVVWAVWLRRRRPEVYAGIGQGTRTIDVATAAGEAAAHPE